jgi:hypothetical protein
MNLKMEKYVPPKHWYLLANPDSVTTQKILVDCGSFLSYLFMSTARNGSRILQGLAPEERATCIYTLADLLLSKEKEMLEANSKDLEEATNSGLSKPLLSRLSLTPAKLKSLAIGEPTTVNNFLSLGLYPLSVFKVLKA